MACGCNKKKTRNKKNLVKRGKKTASRKSLPLITIRKRTPAKRKPVKSN